MHKPDVDSIEGLSPAISIEQKTGSRNPRSTVGTATEIYDYLRLLWARVGTVHCYNCGQPIASQTIQQMVDQVLELPEGRASRCWRRSCASRRDRSTTCWQAAPGRVRARQHRRRAGRAGRAAQAAEAKTHTSRCSSIGW
jgi:excinuclease UvrABC ATPase subunit